MNKVENTDTTKADKGSEHLELSDSTSENTKWYSHTRKEKKYLTELNINLTTLISHLIPRYFSKYEHSLKLATTQVSINW